MLGDISPDELAGIVKDRLGSPAMPYLHDEQVRRRAVGLAAAQGFFEYSQRQLTPDEPIGVLPHSGFREFRRTGNRTNYERLTPGPALGRVRKHLVDHARTRGPRRPHRPTRGHVRIPVCPGC